MILKMASGLNKNYGKSEMMGINIPPKSLQYIVDTHGCKMGYWPRPTSYLGLQLGDIPRNLPFRITSSRRLSANYKKYYHL